jgi:hypothetical protein
MSISQRRKQSIVRKIEDEKQMKDYDQRKNVNKLIE